MFIWSTPKFKLSMSHQARPAAEGLKTESAVPIFAEYQKGSTFYCFAGKYILPFARLKLQCIGAFSKLRALFVFVLGAAERGNSVQMASFAYA